jgi:hypothetical protein
MSNEYLNYLADLATDDVQKLQEAQKNYGDSWKKRGGVGAYMVMVRKFDRLDNYMPSFDYDIFKALETDSRDESVLDDIHDARRYLLLIEAEYLARKFTTDENISLQAKSSRERGRST